jgi:deoxyribonuclease V
VSSGGELRARGGIRPGAVRGAVAALVVAADPAFASVVVERVVGLAEVEPYRPGAFFRRELPALRAVLADAGRIDLLVVDGYVHLDPHGRPGLGAHAHAEFAVPVIGVAKTPFRGATHAIEVHRGGASRPLYVTALGIEAERAATLGRRMGGPYRLPDALRRVDTLSRTSSITATPTTAES